jgi:hypothetical protein
MFYFLTSLAHLSILTERLLFLALALELHMEASATHRMGDSATVGCPNQCRDAARGCWCCL